MFKNKTAVVTGASSGIGKETAAILATQGAKVFAVARRQDRLDELARAHQNIIPVCQDVTQDLAALKAALGNSRVDILVNNAGGALGKESIQDAPREKWQAMIELNVTALIAVTQLILPSMISSGSGDIVNVGSIAAFEHYAGGATYCGVKAAVHAMTEAWRHDLLGKNIRVMGIHPGMVNTEFSLVRFGGDQKAADAIYTGLTPLSGGDIANAIVWMLSCPRHVNVETLVIKPIAQANVWDVKRVR